MLARNAIAVVVFSAAFAACARDGGAGGVFATGSSSVAVTGDGASVLVASPEAGTLARFEIDARKLSRAPIGLDPYRVAIAGERALVTLRGEGDVVVLRGASGEEEARVEVGASPAGIVVSPDGAFAYVATIDGVAELDLSTLLVARSWAVEDQPTWLAIDPRGLSLFVVSASGARLTHIALDEGVARRVELPDAAGGWYPLEKTLTGDPCVTLDGSRLLVPARFVDDRTPLPDVPGMESSPGALFTVRSMPAIISIPLGASAEPFASRAAVFPAYVSAWTGPRELTQRQIGGRIVSLAASPYANQIVVAYEGGEGVLVTQYLELDDSTLVATSGLTGSGGAPASTSGGASYGSSGMLSIPGRRPGLATGVDQNELVLAVPSDAGPRGFAFDARGSLWVDARIDGTLSRIDAGLLAGAFSDDVDEAAYAISRLQVSLPIEIEQGLEAKQRLGRELFYLGPYPSSFWSGASCASCHLDRTSDDVAWPLASGGARTARALQDLPADKELLARWSEVANGVVMTEEQLEALAAFIEASR